MMDIKSSYQSLFSKGNGDTSIETKNGKFNVISYILYEKSDKFFDSKAGETDNCRIDLTNYNLEAAKEFFEYIYYGKSIETNDTNILMQLLSLADLYQIKEYSQRIMNIIRSLITLIKIPM